MSARIAMVVLSYYPADPRPRREAEALLDQGYLVDVICLRGEEQARHEIVNGVGVYRLPLKHRRGSKIRYLWEYAVFFVMSFFTLSSLYLHKKYRLIHVHNMPDFLVFCSLLPRLLGAKIILDLHDPMPEVFMAKYSMTRKDYFIQLLCLQEKHSIRFSDLVLTPNMAFRDLFVSRGCPESKIHIVMNSPDEKIFSCLEKSEMSHDNNNHVFQVMYHGTIIKRNGLDVALKAVAQIREKIPHLVFHVYGGGEYLEPTKSLSAKLGLKDSVNFHGHVPLEKIAQDIQFVDVGLIPNKPSIHWENAVPTRIFECLCMRKPVIVPRTKGIMDYFDEESMFFHEPGDQESLADAIFEVYQDSERRKSVLHKGISVYRKYRWELQRQHFLEIVNNLIINNPGLL